MDGADEATEQCANAGRIKPWRLAGSICNAIHFPEGPTRKVIYDSEDLHFSAALLVPPHGSGVRLNAFVSYVPQPGGRHIDVRIMTPPAYSSTASKF